MYYILPEFRKKTSQWSLSMP